MSRSSRRGRAASRVRRCGPGPASDARSRIPSPGSATTDASRTRGREKRTAPGALRPEPLRCPGQLNGTNHPPMVDLPALASRSTSHRPSCPKARRAMPRCRPGSRLPGPLPSRRRAAAPGKPGAPIRRREDRSDAAPVGVAHPRCGPSTPSDRPANRPAIRGGSVAFVPAPSPLTSTLPKRGSGPFSGLRHPKVTSARLGSPVPVGVALSGTGHTLRHRITPGQGVFRKTQGSPQNFPVTHRKRACHPPFMHSVDPAASRRAACPTSGRALAGIDAAP